MQDPSKTEKPTAKRREKSRKEGRVARSPEIGSVAVLLATLAALAIDGPSLLRATEGIMAGGLDQASVPSLAGPGGMQQLTSWGLHAFARVLAPVALAAAGAGLIANVAQVGLHVSGKSLKPSFQKLNVAAGIKRMVGPGQLVELAKNLAKTAVISGVAFSAVWARLPTIGLLVGAPPGLLLSDLAQLVFSIALRVGAALALIAALDFVWQRYRHERSLRMSKDEIKREAREADVSPEMKGQIRRRQSEQSRKRMLADVPTADVVVVNPTHYAVALRYDGSRSAPEVVAKGVDLVALAIRRIAEEAGVAIVHEPPLARALYRDVELGEMIPEEFFAAVAQVLAFVYRTAKRRIA